MGLVVEDNFSGEVFFLNFDSLFLSCPCFSFWCHFFKTNVVNFMLLLLVGKFTHFQFANSVFVAWLPLVLYSIRIPSPWL